MKTNERTLEIGTRLARKIFERRGNHSEAHLTEGELAAVLALAAEQGIAIGIGVGGAIGRRTAQ